MKKIRSINLALCLRYKVKKTKQSLYLLSLIKANPQKVGFCFL